MTQAKETQCIGVIVDGNRRWARQHGVSTLRGHQVGYKKLKEMIGWAQEAQIPAIISYVFSTENWKRSKREVNYLMNLVSRVFTNDLQYFHKKNARIKVVGNLELCSQKVQNIAHKAEEKTKNNTGIVIVLAFSYGGRDEIVSAVNSLLSKKPAIKKISKELFSEYLWTRGIPDPDIIIRTSGEMRLSNFLLWQGAYSELFFPKFYFPDFTKEAFFDILKEFKQRQRRFGK